MIAKKIYDIDEVFGTTRGVPGNYISRPGIDDKFKNGLKAGKHIILHGSSKQGKTSLRKKNIQQGSFVLINCETQYTLQQLFETILKLSGFEIHDSGTKEFKDSVKFCANFKIFSAEKGKEEKKERAYKKLAFDISNVNDVIEALNSIEFNKLIIIEDFHFLEDQVQKEFSNCMKVFYENTNIIFIVIGVWADKHKLLHFNGDLEGRIEDIDVDNWSDEKLRSIISTGEELLNIQFHKNFSDILIQNAYGSVSLVMAFCSAYCMKNEIDKTQRNFKQLEKEVNFYELIAEVIDFRNTRFRSLLNKLAKKNDTGDLKISFVIALAILISRPQELQNGITIEYVQELYIKIDQKKTISRNDVLSAMEHLKKWQMENNIRPSLLEYNEATGKLYIIDKPFFLWLAHNSITDLLHYSESDEETNLKVKLILASR